MDITQAAKEIRAILKANFPSVKFSVKSSRFSQGSAVNVSWADGPTTDQVDQLIGEYGDRRSRFIETSRKHSHELVTQAIAVWREQNPEYSHLTVTCKGDTSWGFRAEFDLSEFNCGSFDLQDCEHSLINDLIYGSAFDGTNLIRSQEDTEDCEPETVSAPESSEVEEIEFEIEAPIIPLAVYKVENEVYIQANFPNQNKQDWIDDYRTQASKICQAKIVKVVHLSPKDYQTFLYSLMSNREWLAGGGGSGSHYVSEKYGDDWDRLFNDELETKKWRRECYEVSILVSDGNDYILVNPEGHNYARYVGLRYHATLEYILEKSNVNLSISPTELNSEIDPATALEAVAPTSNIMLEPADQEALKATVASTEPEQTKPETFAENLDIYQEWIATLIAQGKYTEIKSYEDWLAIELEKMKLEQEEAALEAEIWELQKRLIEMQSKRLKHKANK